MPITLTIKQATAYLYPNDEHTRIREQLDAPDLPAAEQERLETLLKETPALKGRMKAVLAGDGERSLNLDAAVWIKQKDGGEQYYSGNAGGIHLTLFKTKQKKGTDDPDYTGSFGFDQATRMRNAAWKTTDTRQRPYISVETTDRTPQARPAAVQDGDVPTSPPPRTPSKQADPEPADGAPSFF
ncbi:hypothetical protein A9R05_41505 (plasmid) [Burkholderia sp. KK1]|uniref:Uncharacterized protein n=1 Tax=Burkholderia sp. M701 TaxID=326454 RepID=V5YNE6_9BURK|nr:MULTISPECIES: hypothetical protein [Burkholderia]AQH05509.1 hypothetical protein A9R05_41505 [Burkholderia sp. KK1]BAO18779.1 hypothetical protein [Burkholderia sp. M701]